MKEPSEETKVENKTNVVKSISDENIKNLVDEISTLNSEID